MRNTLIVIVVVLALFAGGAVWSQTLQSGNPDVVAANGLHWHPHLSIIVGGTPVVIPAGIGLGAVESPIHTHDASGTIHLEFSGVVHANELALGQFFKVWGRPIDSFGTNMTMSVNGATSTTYGDYVMHDGDKIVLRYDPS